MRLTSAQKKEYREKLAAEQDWMCPVCGEELDKDDLTLDHCHTTGHCRVVAHRMCNAVFGKIEYWAKRSGRKDIIKFIRNCADILNDDHTMKPIYPSHKNEVEKEISRLRKRMRRLKKPKTKAKYQAQINRLQRQLK